MAKTIIYNWKLAYKKLIIKAKKLGYVVGELQKAPANVSDHANMLTKQIIIRSKRSYERKVFILAHELGHVVISEEHIPKESIKQDCQKVVEEYNSNTIAYKLARVEQELEAWDMGKLLIEAVAGKKYITKNFWKTRAEMVGTYMAWATDNRYYYTTPEAIKEEQKNDNNS